MSNTKHIEYTGKDFNSIKENLVNFAKNYFPDSYKDFSASSPGMMFMEMVAYVGDILSFYQDAELQETFLQYAKNPASLYALAYMMGYRPKQVSASEANLTISQTIHFDTENSEPVWSEACKVREGTVVRSTDSSKTTFMFEDTVDFRVSSSADPTTVEILDTDGGNWCLLTKHVKAVSGEIKTFSQTFGNYEPFKTITIKDKNIVGVLDIKELDSTEEWSEVPYLGQDTLFVEDSSEARTTGICNLNLKRVPKRFVTRFNKEGNLEIQFGSGIQSSENDELDCLPDPLNIRSGQTPNCYDVAYDPSNFLYSRSYGLAPTNVTLVIRYLVSQGLDSNVPANTITEFVTTLLGDTDSQDVNLTVTNEEPATGGRDGDTLEEIKQNSIRSFAEQKRMVTLNDFVIRTLSMPSKFGSIAKAYATHDARTGLSVLDQDPLSVSLYILSYDNNKKLQNTNTTIKTNLQTYLSEYLMLTDSINIRDAFIVNIGVQYSIVLRTGYNASDVLLRCTEALKDYFSIEKWSINQVIRLSDVANVISGVQGVQDVKEVTIKNKVSQDGTYSKYSYDIKAATRNNIIYPSYDPCIFEVKNPDIDIEGRVVSFN